MIQPIRTLIRREPALTLSVLSAAAAAICGVIGKPDYTGVLVAVAAALLGLRTQVVPTQKANETAVQAARDAATTTAANLDEGTVGLRGEVTDRAVGVVNDAVALVSGLLKGKR